MEEPARMDEPEDGRYLASVEALGNHRRFVEPADPVSLYIRGLDRVHDLAREGYRLSNAYRETVLAHEFEVKPLECRIRDGPVEHGDGVALAVPHPYERERLPSRQRVLQPVNDRRHRSSPERLEPGTSGAGRKHGVVACE